MCTNITGPNENSIYLCYIYSGPQLSFLGNWLTQACKFIIVGKTAVFVEYPIAFGISYIGVNNLKG